jgi:hypothetical protein
MKLTEIIRRGIFRNQPWITALTGGLQGVVEVEITNPGSSYETAPTVVFGAGAAEATATVESGIVTNIEVDVCGEYTEVPLITFTDGGGSAAAAFARIGATCLDAVVTVNLPIGFATLIYVGAKYNLYRLCAGTDAEASPTVIRPDDYHADTNAKVWKRVYVATDAKPGKYDATAAPAVTDDTADGYEPGSLWIDLTGDKAYVCLDATEGAAVWSRIDNSPLTKLNATAAPGVTNDLDEGYAPGSLWVDVTNDKAYLCLDATDGAAVWEEICEAGDLPPLPLCKYDGTAAPEATNDTTEGYGVGSRWYDVTGDAEYVCLDATEDGAVWTETTGGGGKFGKYDATAAPTANDDSGDGYEVGSIWINVTADDAYIALDVTPTAAVWQLIGDGGACAITGTGTERFLDAGLHIGAASGNPGDNNLLIDGKLGIGITPTKAIHAYEVASSVADGYCFANLNPVIAPSGAIGAGVGFNVSMTTRLDNQAITASGFAFHGLHHAFDVRAQGTGAFYLRGFYASTVLTATASGTFAQVRGFDSAGAELYSAGVTVTDMIHFLARDCYVGAGAITNQYGFYCAELAAGTNKYAFYSAGATPSVFGGPVSAGAGKFAVDADGDVVKINNVTLAWPSANAEGVLTNDGSGNLTWAAPEGGGLFGKYDATTDPTANDDTGDGYVVGSVWVNVTDDKSFICVDNTSTAAVWQQLTPNAAQTLLVVELQVFS